MEEVDRRWRWRTNLDTFITEDEQIGDEIEIFKVMAFDFEKTLNLKSNNLLISERWVLLPKLL